jgi:hypothetical protein
MDIAAILTDKFYGKEWVLQGDDYVGLTWFSDSPKPTEAELEALWPEVDYDRAYKAVERARADAYRETSDPIFFQYQRGDKTEQEWLSAVEAVKEANPYPPAV